MSPASPSLETFWNDYPLCERKCHQDVFSSQSCTLQNSCGCSQGCLCLIDTCLCATPSWLIAVSQCVGRECGRAAVSEAAGIASSGCNDHGLTLAILPQSLIQAGLAAVSSTSDKFSTSSVSSVSSASNTPTSTSSSTSPSTTSNTSSSTSLSSLLTSLPPETGESSSRNPATLSPSLNPSSLVTVSYASSTSSSVNTNNPSPQPSHSPSGGIIGVIVVGAVITVSVIIFISLWRLGVIPPPAAWYRRFNERKERERQFASMNQRKAGVMGTELQRLQAIEQHSDNGETIGESTGYGPPRG